jgi:hypothetical protein
MVLTGNPFALPVCSGGDWKRRHAVALINDLHMIDILTSNDIGRARHVVRYARTEQQYKG